ncbi:MAG: type II toxin-antitoxin system YafQ family toxin [Bacilli bacterium]|nr:type II toxin-antitoxin system YafQ family toxin [Bacilli bacterium]
MIDLQIKVKYKIRYTNDFKKNYKKVKKQGKDVHKLKDVIIKLANGLQLEEKYKNHILINSKHYKNCGECHIEPDWLLVYQYIDNELILVLIATGSHSELF